MKTTWEAISIRPAGDGRQHVITVRTRWTPGWWDRLLGRQADLRDDVYIGAVIWHDAATGERQSYATNRWLEDQVRRVEALELYRGSIDGLPGVSS